MASLSEIQEASGTLAILLQSLEETLLVFELRNGLIVEGYLESADAHMKSVSDQRLREGVLITVLQCFTHGCYCH